MGTGSEQMDNTYAKAKKKSIKPREKNIEDDKRKGNYNSTSFIIIINCVGGELFDEIFNCETAHVAWSKVETAHKHSTGGKDNKSYHDDTLSTIVSDSEKIDVSTQIWAKPETVKCNDSDEINIKELYNAYVIIYGNLIKTCDTNKAFNLQAK